MLNQFSSVRMRVICLPDIDKPIGGVKQLFKHVEHLVSLGLDAAMVTESPDFHPSWFTSRAPIKSFQHCLDDCEFHDLSTILVLPETYINVDLSNFRGVDISGLKRVIFNQNAYYSFGSTPADSNQLREFYHHPNVLHTLCVSSDSYEFIYSCLSVNPSSISRIVNAIEPIFSPHITKSNSFCFMPRKNSDHVHAVLTSLQLSSRSLPTPWTGQPLVNLPHDEIAGYFSTSRIFLSFGFPEGFGLPVAEAMASGCWVIGYTGLGGKELFSFNGSSPVEYGDWTGFIHQIFSVIHRFHDHPLETESILTQQSIAIRSIYSADNELNSIKSSWETILSRISNH